MIQWFGQFAAVSASQIGVIRVAGWQRLLVWGTIAGRPPQLGHTSPPSAARLVVFPSVRVGSIDNQDICPFQRRLPLDPIVARSAVGR
jgi:hypothetical protein